jgi:hypothetical protein
MNTFAQKAIRYFLNIKLPARLPAGVSIINPYEKEVIKVVVEKFYKSYFNDQKERVYILGINPGRFGGGLTGISFTDPVALRNECLIENNLGLRKEISSEFIYEVIGEYGGPKKFFSDFFLSALFPLAILKDGKNFNYYDDKKLFGLIRPGIFESLKAQVIFGASRKYVISLGRKNGDYLKMLNNELKIFHRIEVLDHPRYIMQYKRKFIKHYINEYLRILRLIG